MVTFLCLFHAIGFIRSISGKPNRRKRGSRTFREGVRNLFRNPLFWRVCIVFTSKRGFWNHFLTPSPEVRKPHFLRFSLPELLLSFSDISRISRNRPSRKKNPQAWFTDARLASCCKCRTSAYACCHCALLRHSFFLGQGMGASHTTTTLASELASSQRSRQQKLRWVGDLQQNPWLPKVRALRANRIKQRLYTLFDAQNTRHFSLLDLSPRVVVWKDQEVVNSMWLRLEKLLGLFMMNGLAHSLLSKADKDQRELVTRVTRGAQKDAARGSLWNQTGNYFLCVILIFPMVNSWRSSSALQ